ncbi:hypothetical protein ACFOY4_01385 [Actinomadura syzygii]|uniref:Uncharacterized protein n=1 Tax=Actinomadura syzygii TaxID=1427538 RepID=A0A5D0TR37_9ACTN|nr:hypothetical protein [Actinomadura syzygii]TYC08598.1 hypothetical protein FXF65_37530 [Actinomadura syzygii]
MELIRITTECGHAFEISEEHTLLWAEEIARLQSLAAKSKRAREGATFDCKICGALCLLVTVEDERLVWGRLFHRVMNEHCSTWPADGHGTFSTAVEDHEG